MEPKPPPTAVGTMRISFAVHRQDLGHGVEIHDRGLRAGVDFQPAVAHLRKARFRLDIGMFDETGLERAFDDDIGSRQSFDRHHRT